MSYQLLQVNKFIKIMARSSKSYIIYTMGNAIISLRLHSHQAYGGYYTPHLTHSQQQ